MRPILFEFPIYIFRDYCIIFSLVSLILIIISYLLSKKQKKNYNETNSKLNKKLFYILSILSYLFTAILFISILSLFIRDDKGNELKYIPIISYVTFIGLAFISVIVVVIINTKKLNFPSKYALTISIIGIILAFVGARVGYILTVVLNKSGNIESISDFINLFLTHLDETGMMSFGAVIITIPFGIIYLRAKKLKAGIFLDAISPAVMLGLGIAKLGCLSAGCCFGKICENGFFGVDVNLFDKDSPAFKHYATKNYLANLVGSKLYIYPAQLIESISYTLIFIILEILYNKITLNKRNFFNGFVFSIGLIIYGIARFLIEYIRVNPIRESFFNLTDSQITSMSLVITGIIMILYKLIEKFFINKKESNVPLH